MARQHRHFNLITLDESTDPWPIMLALEPAVREEFAHLFPDRELFESVTTHDPRGNDEYDNCSQALLGPREHLDVIHLRLGVNQLMMAYDTDHAARVMWSREVWKPTLSITVEGPTESIVQGLGRMMERLARDEIERQKPPAAQGITSAAFWWRAAQNPWVYGIGTTVVGGILVAWIIQR